jgi:hypothetical protein
MTDVASIQVNDHVRVTHDIGDLAVSVGDVGVVCGVWREPAMAYEVEFPQRGAAYALRTIVFEEQLELAASQCAELAA